MSTNTEINKISLKSTEAVEMFDDLKTMSIDDLKNMTFILALLQQIMDNKSNELEIIELIKNIPSHIMTTPVYEQLTKFLSKMLTEQGAKEMADKIDACKLTLS